MRSSGFRDALLAGAGLALLNLALWRLGISQLVIVHWPLLVITTLVYVQIGRREGRRGSTGAGVLGMMTGFVPGLLAGVPMTAAVFHDPAVTAGLAHPPTEAIYLLTLGLGLLGSTLYGGLVAYLFGRPLPQPTEDGRD